MNKEKKSKAMRISSSSKSRTILGIVCIVTALIIGFVLMPLVSGHKVAAAATTEKKQETTSSKDSDYELKKGQYLISVSTKNFCDSVSGKLKSGDIATVFIPPTTSTANAVTSGTSITAAENPPELQYVKVIAVTTAQGQDTDGNIQSSSNTSNNQPATVTLLVNVKQAAILAGTEQNTVHFALAYRGGGEKAQELLDKQKEYFSTVQNDESSQTDSESSITTSENPTVEVS